jgi:hypothetical protein
MLARVLRPRFAAIDVRAEVVLRFKAIATPTKESRHEIAAAPEKPHSQQRSGQTSRASTIAVRDAG